MLIESLIRAMNKLVLIMEMFCRTSLYATAGTIGIMLVSYYFIFQSIPSDKLNLAENPVANVLWYCQRKGYDISVEQIHDIVFFVWFLFFSITMSHYLFHIINFNRNAKKY